MVNFRKANHSTENGIRNGTVISDKKYLEIWLFLKLFLFENLVNSGKWSHFSEIQIRIFHQLENSVSVLVHAQGSSFYVVGL